eukprot:4587452-Lingulodinium_polyedra.AAC.1
MAKGECEEPTTTLAKRIQTRRNGRATGPTRARIYRWTTTGAGQSHNRTTNRGTTHICTHKLGHL